MKLLVKKGIEWKSIILKWNPLNKEKPEMIAIEETDPKTIDKINEAISESKEGEIKAVVITDGETTMD